MSISYRIAAYAKVTAQEIIFNPPLTTGFFKDFFWHLKLNTSLETRKYPFKTRCSQLIQESETIELPNYSKVIHQPAETKAITDNPAAIETKSHAEGGSYTFQNKISINKRIFELKDWSAVRSVVQQHKKSLEDNLVLGK